MPKDPDLICINNVNVYICINDNRGVEKWWDPGLG